MRQEIFRLVKKALFFLTGILFSSGVFLSCFASSEWDPGDIDPLKFRMDGWETVWTGDDVVVEIHPSYKLVRVFERPVGKNMASNSSDSSSSDTVKRVLLLVRIRPTDHEIKRTYGNWLTSLGEEDGKPLQDDFFKVMTHLGSKFLLFGIDCSTEDVLLFPQSDGKGSAGGPPLRINLTPAGYAEALYKRVCEK